MKSTLLDHRKIVCQTYVWEIFSERNAVSVETYLQKVFYPRFDFKLNFVKLIFLLAIQIGL